jgi:hypothetical protein
MIMTQNTLTGARGYVQIPDRTSYNDLGEPYTVPVNLTHDGPAYMMSVFHQLHCLVSLVLLRADTVTY